MTVVAIDAPEPATEEWLLKQLGCLQGPSFRFATSQGDSFPYLDVLEDVSDPLVLFAALDSHSVEGWYRVFQVVVFERDDVAHVGPAFYRELGGLPTRVPLDDHRDPQNRYRRLTWAEGILALVESLAHHAYGVAGTTQDDVRGFCHRYGIVLSEVGDLTTVAP